VIPAAFPWKLAAGVAAAAVVAAVLWWAQARIRVSYQAEQERDAIAEQFGGYRELVESNAIRASARMELDGKADAETAVRIENLEVERARLARAVARIPSTVEVPDENGRPVLRIAGDWWLCVSAFVSRDAADAAACEALAGAAGVPNAVSR
jgi:hypothetical protein